MRARGTCYQLAGYNPAAKTVWEEGLRLPAIKLYDRGKYQSDIWDLILLNVKSRHLVEGDLHCQIGATARGEEALAREARDTDLEGAGAGQDRW